MKVLIARLEAATEGSWELDSAVQEVLTGKGFSEDDDWLAPWPRYTTSIDAALTLVPEGCELYLDIYPNGSATGCVFEPAPDEDTLSTGPNSDLCDGATPALALIIAALKARQ